MLGSMMRIAVVLLGAFLLLLGLGLLFATLVVKIFIGFPYALLVAGSLGFVGIVILVVGLVTGRRPRAVMPPASPGTYNGICPRCGGGLPLTVSKIRCLYCGKNVVPIAAGGIPYPLGQGQPATYQRTGIVQQPPRFCDKCGLRLHPSSLFCSRCGRNLSDSRACHTLHRMKELL